MQPSIQNEPEWLPEKEAAAVVGLVTTCPDGVQREVQLLGALESAAPYVYREGWGPCFLNRDAIAALREAVLAAATAAMATAAEAPSAAGTVPPARAQLP